MDFLHHALVELGLRLMHTGCIDENDLRHGTSGVSLGLLTEWKFEDALNTGARGLRLVRDDRELLTEKRVEQRRLARIGAADNRDEPGA